MRGPTRSRVRRASPFAVGVVAAILLGGCATTDGPATTFPPVPAGPDLTVSPTVALTRADLVRVLGARSLILTDAQVPFRPAEAERLADAARAVYQVQLPDDPGGGYVVVYELSDADEAAAAAREQAGYLASGPGRVQAPLGTVHVIRIVGSTVVLYSWLPGEARDPAAADIQSALENLGIGVDVPS